MSPILQPWHILLACLCGLVNQRQQQIIEFQNAQIEALLKQLGRRRLLLDDDQRRLLAVKAYGRVLVHNVRQAIPKSLRPAVPASRRDRTILPAVLRRAA